MKYRSGFEEKVAGLLGKKWKYEPETISYTIQSDYLPDFVFYGKKNKIYLEIKGRFRATELKKYKAVNESCIMLGYEFIICLQKPDLPIRKGAKLTHAEWCTKNRIRWVAVSDLPIKTN